MARRAIGFYFLQLGASIPNFPDINRTIEVHPLIGACERMQQAADMSLPIPRLKSKSCCPSRNPPGS